MKTTISVSDFRDAFRRYDRQENFCYEGLGALFDHLEQLEEDTGEEMELDVISLCCDYSEYSTALEAAEDKGFDLSDFEDEDEDEREERALEWLREETTVITHSRGVIVQSF